MLKDKADEDIPREGMSLMKDTKSSSPRVILRLLTHDNLVPPIFETLGAVKNLKNLSIWSILLNIY